MNDLPAVQTLLDKNEIAELLTRYMRAIDRGDIAALRSCYAPGATEEHGGMYSGPAQGYVDTIERPRPEAWLYGTLDPATLLQSRKYPDDIVYDGNRD